MLPPFRKSWLWICFSQYNGKWAWLLIVHLFTCLQKPKAILIKDKQGEETVTFAGLVKRTTQQNIQRGSLLEPIAPEIQTQRSDRNAAHNYQTVLKNRLITLFCAANDLAPLNKYEYDLLCGILSREARYQTFISLDILDWGSKLKACDAVCVSIRVWHVAESEATKKVPAVIRYVGPVDGLPGITFGVEITVRIEHLAVVCVGGVLCGQILLRNRWDFGWPHQSLVHGQSSCKYLVRPQKLF